MEEEEEKVGMEVEEDSSEHESNTESDHAEEASRESSSTDEDLPVRTRKQKEKLRRKRRRRDGTDSGARREQKRQEEKKAAKLRELLEAEPELNTLPDDVICPVCLDLLHEPFQVEPCGHIFCEPCLRRLGQKNPMNCSCPLCRCGALKRIESLKDIIFLFQDKDWILQTPCGHLQRNPRGPRAVVPEKEEVREVHPSVLLPTPLAAWLEESVEGKTPRRQPICD